MCHPYVSIIIPAYNEEKYINKCLYGIANQEFSDYELILVDNGSEDNTIPIASAYTKNILQDKTSNIAGLRNLGASKARGRILAFLDADCVPEKDWISKGLARIENNQVGVTGCNNFMPPNSTWLEKVWYESEPKGVFEVNHIGSANFFVRIGVFNAVGGFNMKMTTGEDYDLCQRIKAAGYKIVSDDSIRVAHLRGAKTLKDRFKKEIWYGRETRYIIKNNKFYPPFVLSLVYLALITIVITSILFLSHKLALCGFYGLFGLISVVSLRRCYISGRFKFFFALIPIYFVYFLGRTVSLVYFFYKK